MAIKKIKMSQEGYDALEERLEYLINVSRKEVAEKLKEARSQGDLSENAEYDAAKDEQGIIEGEIHEIEFKLANAEIVVSSDLSDDEVGVGSKVKLKDMEFDEILDIQIVGSTESDPDKNKISEDSPIGLAVVGAKVGDVVTVAAPMGEIQMEILEISK